MSRTVATRSPHQAKRVAWLLAALAMALLALPLAASAQDTAPDELPAAGTHLEPGRYSSRAVGPSIEFRVEDGWVSAGPAEGPIFTLERADQPGTVLTVTRFDGAAFVDSCDSTSLTDVDVSVERLMAIVGGNPMLNSAPPKVTDIDGYLGLTLDVATPPFQECALPFLLLWALPMDDGEFVQVAGQQSRFIAVDVEGDVIVVAVESFPGVPFGSLLDASMDIVDSMRITPGDLEPPSPSPSPAAISNENPSPPPEASDPPASPTPVAPDGDDASA